MLSVVVPTCNRNDLLSNCLDLLAPGIQTIDSSIYEVIVTDDSKNNLTKELLQEQYKWVSWVEGPKKGPAANRNNGAGVAKGEWLIFIDDDCLPNEQLLEEYFKAKDENRTVEVFEGCVKADRECRSFIEESPINESGGYLWSCNFMISKRLFRELGGFDEEFPYAAMEDVDFNYRLKKKNIEILFLDSSFVIHPWRTQSRMYYVTVERFKSLLYFLKKHPEMSKELNAIYYMRISLAGTIVLLTKSLKYSFRGVGGKLIFIILHLFFSFYLLLQNNSKFKNYLAFLLK